MNRKLILFMTSLSLLAAPVCVHASEYTEPVARIENVEDRGVLKAATGEYRTWKQTDGRWQHIHLGGSVHTMGDSGCLVTAIATLMVHSGSADESTIDPGKLCEYLNGNGGFTSNGELYWGKINGAVPGFKLANWGIDLSGSQADKVAQIGSYLNQGYYIVVSVGNGAHWVAVDSLDGNGDVNIFEPAYSYTKLFQGYSNSGITRMAVFSSDGSGPEIGGGGQQYPMEDFSANGSVNVGASYLNVRKGPGTEYDYLVDQNGNQITLHNGEAVVITGKGKSKDGDTWYRVSINGMTGYVFAAYIQVVENALPETPQQAEDGKVNGSYVNIRSGAGTNYSIIAVASQNDDVKILGEEKASDGGSWYKIQYKGSEGYIFAEYVTKTNTPAPEPENPGQTTEKPAKVNASQVNVRSGAGTQHGVVATLGVNTPITVIGEGKDSNGATWYRIRFNGGEGYMHSDYVTIDNEGSNEIPTPQPQPQPQKKGVVNDDYVNVRSGAGTGHSRVTCLRKDTPVTVTGEEKDSSGATWYAITYAGGSGYMHSDYITINGDDTPAPTPTPTPTPTPDAQRKGQVNASYVNVRSGAGTNHGIVGNLSSGKDVLILGEEKDTNGATWYKIQFDGREGYMHSDYITVLNDGGSGSNTPSQEAIGHEGVVNAALLNVRRGPSTSDDVVDILKSGVSVMIEDVKVDADGTVWYQIGYAGTSAFAMAQFISVK